jgi:predicted nucleic acid-binding protein
MNVIVDSNLVFSAMLNTQSRIGDIILNSPEIFEFQTCEYLREEIENHKDKIMARTGYDEQEYNEVRFLIYRNLTFFTEALIPFEVWKTAADYVRDIDMNDIAYVALSLHLDIKLWTGDKLLREGLIKKGFKNLITIEEMLSIRERENK